MTNKIPSVALDLYEPSQLQEPFETYRMLRDLGPLVYLENVGMYVASRYRDVKEILSRPEAFISGKGVMMNDIANNAFAGRVGICSDGTEHARIRGIEQRPLAPAALEALRSTITSEADHVVASLSGRETFEAVSDLAQYLPLSIVSNLVGLPEQGRERMLQWAAANFDLFGPLNDRSRESLGVFQEMTEYAMTQCVREKLKPGSWAARLHDAADAGEISDEEARLMALTYVGPSLDTTILATASAIWLFARHPEQWDRVRQNPQIIPTAINEAIRLESPLQSYSRFAVADFELDGVTIPAQSRVIVLLGSANRDERHWANPDVFDVERANASSMLGFGFGKHHCMGNRLARLEISALLQALCRQVSRFELLSAERIVNNTLRGFRKLQIRAQHVAVTA